MTIAGFVFLKKEVFLFAPEITECNKGKTQVF